MTELGPTRRFFFYWRPWLVAAFVAAAGVGGASVYWLSKRSSPDLTAERPPADPPRVEDHVPDPLVRKALAEARAAVLAAPRSGAAWGTLGMVLAAHLYEAESLVAFAEAERFDPSEPRWPYLQGMILRRSDPQQAVAQWQRAASLGSDIPSIVRLRLAELLLQLDRLAEAREQLQLLLESTPRDGRAALLLARLELREGGLSNAYSHLQMARRDSRTKKAATILEAEVHYRRGNATLAAEVNGQAATLPDDPPWQDPYSDELAERETGRQALVGRAGRLLVAGRSYEAVSLLQEAVRHYPDSAYAWLMLGKAHLSTQNLPAAEQALQHAVAQEPASVEAHFLMGVALHLQAKHAEALASFRRGATAQPKSAQAHYMIGQCLVQQKDDAGAIQAFREAIRCKPQFAEAHRDLGELLARTGQAAEARKHLQHVLRLASHDVKAAELLQALQQAHAREGPPEEKKERQSRSSVPGQPDR